MSKIIPKEEKPKMLKETNTFIIYTPEKCGSTTVLNALQSVGLDAHRCTSKNIRDYHYRDAPTITMVRDPIAWMFSVTWEWEISPKTIKNCSATNYMLERYLEWHDNHYRPITGVNIFGQQYRKIPGWKIFSIRSLVICTHMLTDNLGEALCDFLPIYTDREFKPEDFDVQHKARGEDKFGPEYKEFVDQVKFPHSFLVDLYNSKYCRQFFRTGDMNEWIKKWSEA